LIRHGALCLASAIGTLTVTVIKAAFGTLLVAAVGRAVLPESRLAAAGWAAILLAAIAAGANPEQRLASPAPANARSEEHVAGSRHVRWRRGWTIGSRSWQGKTSLRLVACFLAAKSRTLIVRATGVHTRSRRAPAR